jgi:hypothetical protein
MPVQARGTEYVALTNLSISRGAATRDARGERQADVVHRGETVTLADDVAQGFLTRHRMPVIRKKSESDEPASRVTARDLFGRAPGAEQFGARPDPAGASRVVVNEDVPEQGIDPEHARKAPEANDPQVDLNIDPDAAKDKRNS